MQQHQFEFPAPRNWAVLIQGPALIALLLWLSWRFVNDAPDAMPAFIALLWWVVITIGILLAIHRALWVLYGRERLTLTENRIQLQFVVGPVPWLPTLHRKNLSGVALQDRKAPDVSNGALASLTYRRPIYGVNHGPLQLQSAAGDIHCGSGLGMAEIRPNFEAIEAIVGAAIDSSGVDNKSGV